MNPNLIYYVFFYLNTSENLFKAVSEWWWRAFKKHVQHSIRSGGGRTSLYWPSTRPGEWCAQVKF